MCVFTLPNVSAVCPVIIAESDRTARAEVGTSCEGGSACAASVAKRRGLTDAFTEYL